MRSLHHFVFPKRRANARGNESPRRRRSVLDLETLEGRIVPSTTTYSIDGTGNNLSSAAQGSAGTDLIRVSPVAYADGISALSLAIDQSARVISDLLNNQADPANPGQDLETRDQNNLSDYGYSWGQFLDHDMDLTTTNSGEVLSIPADRNDPNGMGDQTFVRSTYDPATGTSTSHPRQQVNSVTSYLDLSQVYGSSAAIADALRTHSGGLLKTSPGNMLPYDNSTYFTAAQLAVINMANDAHAVATDNLFVTGDVRGNENVELTALQTLFVRNHNLIATQLQKLHPGWTDEQLYQEARRLNIAEYQEITYNYYLPDLLGAGALSKYTGYKANVNASISTEFSTIGFRFGHSLLDGEIERHTNVGVDSLPNDPAGASLSLATDFFDPNVLNPNGVIDPLTGHISSDIGALLKAQADGNAQADDLLAVNDVRNLLFGNGGATDNGMDLIARDVERARDHGIGTYNQVRQAYGLKPVTSFAQITSNVQVQKALQAAYGTVDNIDPFEGGLAEDHVAGSDMGPLFSRILSDQFSRLRDGDRLFYLNQKFSPEELKIMQQGDTLTKVIEANTNITNLQPDVFVFKASISGTVTGAPGGTGTRTSPLRGLPGITVELQNSDGEVVATTVTDSQGRYSFTQQNGVSATGNYTVSLVLPAGASQSSANPSSILISRGDANISGVNFVLNTQSTQPKATHFGVLLPQNVQAGQPFTVVVEAQDVNNHLASGFTGTITLALGTADSGASLPASYTFTARDHGIHAFRVTLAATGKQTVTVSSNGASGSASTVVHASQSSTVTHFALLFQALSGGSGLFGGIGQAIVGSPVLVSVVALNAANQIVTGFTGTVTFSSSDATSVASATRNGASTALSSFSYTFTASDKGSHLFALTFDTPGLDSLTVLGAGVTDTASVRVRS
jgi:hypothetical protein